MIQMSPKENIRVSGTTRAFFAGDVLGWRGIGWLIVEMKEERWLKRALLFHVLWASESALQSGVCQVWQLDVSSKTDVGPGKSDSIWLVPHSMGGIGLVSPTHLGCCGANRGIGR